MSQNHLELAFYGELRSGFNEVDVKANIAELFKASVDQVERMFAGQRVVIRNKLDAETAQKYIQAMAKRGAACKIEIMGQPGVEYQSVEPTEDVTISTPAPSPARQAAAPAQEVPESNAPTSSMPRPSNSASTDTETETEGNGLRVAGEEVSNILASSSLSLDPVGVRLSEESEPVAEVELSELAQIDVLPPGSDLVDPVEDIPVSLPDISHISIKDD